MQLVMGVMGMMQLLMGKMHSVTRVKGTIQLVTGMMEMMHSVTRVIWDDAAGKGGYEDNTAAGVVMGMCSTRAYCLRVWRTCRAVDKFTVAHWSY